MLTRLLAPDIMDTLWANAIRRKDLMDGTEYVIFMCEHHGDSVASDRLHFPEHTTCLQCTTIGFLYRKTLNSGGSDEQSMESLYAAARNANQDIQSGKWDYKPLAEPTFTVMDDDEEEAAVEPKDRINLPN